LPEPPLSKRLEVGMMTTVQLPLSKHRLFVKRLLKATDGALSLSELALEDGASSVYVIPQPVEQAVRSAKGWQNEADWIAGLQDWGALAVNVLDAETVFRLIDIGRVKAAVTKQVIKPPPVVKKVPRGATGRQIKTLPSLFQGPYDWHLQGCKVPQAWAMFAASAEHQAGLPWQSIRVGHMDTGYTEHTALAWHQGVSATVQAPLGFDFFENQTDPRDPFWPSGNPGHGTRTSATIGGFDPEATGGPFYGAAPGVKIVPYRVTDAVVIDHVKRQLAQAIHDALGKGCVVISISLGGIWRESQLSDALDAAYEAGAIVVCAAGNLWKEVIYPGRYNRCVTMGGVAPGRQPWGGSACGQYVDVCAPAQQIRRVRPEKLPVGQAATGVVDPPDGSGTSYATALCAGVAALWLAWHGADKLKTAYPEAWMKAAAFKQLLRSTADVPSDWDTSQYGSGIINAEALLKATLPLAGALHKANPASGLYDPAD
jgi:hypothetical protein